MSDVEKQIDGILANIRYIPFGQIEATMADIYMQNHALKQLVEESIVALRGSGYHNTAEEIQQKLDTILK
jgi:hypothetical protein